MQGHSWFVSQPRKPWGWFKKHVPKARNTAWQKSSSAVQTLTDAELLCCNQGSALGHQLQNPSWTCPMISPETAPLRITSRLWGATTTQLKERSLVVLMAGDTRFSCHRDPRVSVQAHSCCHLSQECLCISMSFTAPQSVCIVSTLKHCNKRHLFTRLCLLLYFSSAKPSTKFFLVLHHSEKSCLIPASGTNSAFLSPGWISVPRYFREKGLQESTGLS